MFDPDKLDALVAEGYATDRDEAAAMLVDDGITSGAMLDEVWELGEDE